MNVVSQIYFPALLPSVIDMLLLLVSPTNYNRVTFPWDTRVKGIREYRKQSSLVLGLESEVCRFLCDLGKVTQFSESQSPLL